MMKMSWPLLLSGLLILGGHYLLMAQESSDPAARKVIQDLKARYGQTDATSTSLRVTVAVPEQEPEVTTGKLLQQGQKYQLDLGSNAWYSDGQTVWIHLKDRKEVQIHSASAAGGSETIFTPRSILNRFDNGDYIYVLNGTGVENKRAVRYVEFKPRDRNGEFVKLRLSVAAKTPEIVKFEAFGRDGTRYTLDILGTTTPGAIPADRFVFDPKTVPGIHIEDLRID